MGSTSKIGSTQRASYSSAFPAALQEGEHLYSLVAEVPGVHAEELDVQVQPFRVFIIARNKEVDQVHGQNPRKILKAIDLSSEIEPQTVIAELLAGVLTVSMRKACASAKATTHESHSKCAPSRSGQLRKQAGIAKRYAAAAKEHRERATAKQKKARARAVAGHKDADHRSEDLIPCASDSPRDFEAGVLAAARG